MINSIIVEILKANSNHSIEDKDISGIIRLTAYNSIYLRQFTKYSTKVFAELSQMCVN